MDRWDAVAEPGSTSITIAGTSINKKRFKGYPPFPKIENAAKT
jgi:hypothetical protein